MSRILKMLGSVVVWRIGDSVAGVATGCVLDGPGFESWAGAKDVSKIVQIGWGGGGLAQSSCLVFWNRAICV